MEFVCCNNCMKFVAEGRAALEEAAQPWSEDRIAFYAWFHDMWWNLRGEIGVLETDPSLAGLNEGDLTGALAEAVWDHFALDPSRASQPVEEPVAWRWERGDCERHGRESSVRHYCVHCGADEGHARPDYVEEPQPRKDPPAEVTEEMVYQFALQSCMLDTWDEPGGRERIKRGLEVALAAAKEKTDE
jgi:hypothetical protein